MNTTRETYSLEKKKTPKTGYNFPNTCFVSINKGPVKRMAKVDAYNLPANQKVTFLSRTEAKKRMKKKK